MVAVPLVLSMGWVNSPPTFTAVIETVADVANQRLQSPSYHSPPHHLGEMAATVPLPKPSVPTGDGVSGTALQFPDLRDPSLPTTGDPLEYVDIFLDDFISLAQQPTLRRVRRTLLHTIDHVFSAIECRGLSLQERARLPEEVTQGRLQLGHGEDNTLVGGGHSEPHYSPASTSNRAALEDTGQHPTLTASH